MTNIWQRFNEITNKEEVAEAKSVFEQPKAGEHIAYLVSIEPAESNAGLPMSKGRFKEVDGGKYLFYNQPLQNLNYPNITAMNIANAITVINGLLEEDVNFTNLEDLADLMLSMNELDENGNIITLKDEFKTKKYIIDITYGNKDLEQKFPKFKIKGVVEEDGGDEEGEDVEL